MLLPYHFTCLGCGAQVQSVSWMSYRTIPPHCVMPLYCGVCSSSVLDAQAAGAPGPPAPAGRPPPTAPARGDPGNLFEQNFERGLSAGAPRSALIPLQGAPVRPSDGAPESRQGPQVPARPPGMLRHWRYVLLMLVLFYGGGIAMPLAMALTTDQALGVFVGMVAAFAIYSAVEMYWERPWR